MGVEGGVTDLKKQKIIEKQQKTFFIKLINKTNKQTTHTHTYISN